jgi:hypothetical protein
MILPDRGVGETYGYYPLVREPAESQRSRLLGGPALHRARRLDAVPLLVGFRGLRRRFSTTIGGMSGRESTLLAPGGPRGRS